MKSLKQWLGGSCVAFTAITLVFLMLNSKNPNAHISVRAMLLYIPCALCIAGGEMLRRWREIPRWIRILASYLISTLSVFLFLYLPIATEGVMRLVIFFLLTILYWIVFGICALIRSRLQILRELENPAPKTPGKVQYHSSTKKKKASKK